MNAQEFEAQVLSEGFEVVNRVQPPGYFAATHTHPWEVRSLILEGAFTLELEGRAPITVKAGEAFVEPPRTKMTGYNRGSGDLKVVIFYASDIDTPFLDPIQ